MNVFILNCLCLLFRSPTCGRCIRSAAGISSQLETAFGSSMKSSLDRETDFPLLHPDRCNTHSQPMFLLKTKTEGGHVDHQCWYRKKKKTSDLLRCIWSVLDLGHVIDVCCLFNNITPSYCTIFFVKYYLFIVFLKNCGCVGLSDNVSVNIMHNVWMSNLRLNAKRKAERYSRCT